MLLAMMILSVDLLLLAVGLAICARERDPRFKEHMARAAHQHYELRF